MENMTDDTDGAGRFTYQPTIILETRRCFNCGSFWAIEATRGTTNCVCPRCAEGKISHFIELADKAQRTARALKGAVTRSKTHVPKKLHK